MNEMTGIERMQRILARKPVDRIGAFEHFWGEAQQRWTEEGHVREDESFVDHFDLDMHTLWAFQSVADLDFGEEVIEQTETTELIRNGNGAILRRHRAKSGTPEHVDFLVKDRRGWQEHIRPFIVNEADDERRIAFEKYRKVRDLAAGQQRFFCCSGLNVFEMMHPICGHEHMLMGMALDPEWIREMADTYADLLIRLMEKLFAAEGKPDGVWFYEDLGFKHKPFMSPQMYRELIFPAHRKTFRFAHENGLPVIVHSCGFVEPLLPDMIEAGMDCLQPMEVKAGMDLPHLKRRFGDRIAFMGGLDVRPLVANDRDAIRTELEAKLPAAMEGGGYCLHSDHSIPGEVDYETYRFFLELGREIGTYR